VLNVRHVLLVGPVAALGDDWLGEVRRSRGRASWRCSHATRRSSSATSTTTWSCWARRRCSWSSSWASGWCDDRDARAGLDGRLVAGVDVGGTKTSVVVTDDGTASSTSTPPDGPVIARRPDRRLVDDARRQLGQDIAAVGVAIPATSTRRRLGQHGRQPGDHAPAAGTDAAGELGVPIFVEHDARAAACG
jgi:hypothetical protein